ncbi:MAG: M23 family metallopeptidase [Saprospiraceae bacterium]|nr:M23 family metallopeptidase [Lewinella sp.]
MHRFSVYLSIVLLLGIAYVWPWAIKQKSDRLEAEAIALQQKTRTEPEAVVKTVREEVPVLQPLEKANIQPVHLQFPVRGKTKADVISYFGDPREGGKRSHEGVDIRADRGTAVLAVADGTVEKVKEGGAGGRQIWLQLDNGWEVYYAHLHAQVVKEGDKVKAGELIGTVGNSGNAQQAGPHLHFCLYPSPKRAVNPLPYLPGQLSLP